MVHPAHTLVPVQVPAHREPLCQFEDSDPQAQGKSNALQRKPGINPWSQFQFSHLSLQTNFLPTVHDKYGWAMFQ